MVWWSLTCVRVCIDWISGNGIGCECSGDQSGGWTSANLPRGSTKIHHFQSYGKKYPFCIVAFSFIERLYIRDCGFVVTVYGSLWVLHELTRQSLHSRITTREVTHLSTSHELLAGFTPRPHAKCQHTVIWGFINTSFLFLSYIKYYWNATFSVFLRESRQTKKAANGA